MVIDGQPLVARSWKGLQASVTAPWDHVQPKPADNAQSGKRLSNREQTRGFALT